MITLDWTLFLQVANFFILMGILQWVLFRPLRNMMQRRRDEVDAYRREAETLDQRLEAEMAVYREKLQQVRLDIDRQRKLLRQDLAAETTRLLTEANEQASEELQAMRDRLVGEKDRAFEELRNKIAPLAECISEKILGRVI